MEYSYKFRIYPSIKQKTLIQKTFGCARFVYNYFLAQRIEVYKSTMRSAKCSEKFGYCLQKFLPFCEK